jgi:uncharacterized protein
MDHIRELSDYFLNEKGWIKNPFFYLASVVSYENNSGIKDSCISGKDYGQLDLFVANLLHSVGSKNMNQLLPARKDLACGAIKYGSYVIDPDGDMYSCFIVIGEKNKKIGNIKRFSEVTNEYVKWMNYEPVEKCLSCSLLPICGGGCPYEYFLHGEPTCDNKIYSFKEKLIMVYNDYMKQKSNQITQTL